MGSLTFDLASRLVWLQYYIITIYYYYYYCFLRPIESLFLSTTPIFKYCLFLYPHVTSFKTLTDPRFIRWFMAEVERSLLRQTSTAIVVYRVKSWVTQVPLFSDRIKAARGSKKNKLKPPKNFLIDTFDRFTLFIAWILNKKWIIN